MAVRAPATSAAGGLSRITQIDVSGGMFPSVAPELIPPNGVYDLTNGLLDEENLVYRRGGSTYLSANIPTSTSVKMLWSGYLEKGAITTVLGTSTGIYTVAANGELKLLKETGGMGNALAGITTFTRPAVFKGKLLIPRPYNSTANTYNGETTGNATFSSPYYAVAGNRLLYAENAKLFETKFASITESEASEYLEVPDGAAITGLEGLRTSCVVFTTRGIWMAGGLSKKLTDASGNDQQTLDRYSADAILWGNAGVASWSGGLVVPCRDDIWLMELGVSSEKAIPFAKISAPILNVYRGYVQAGYQPGLATIYRGHYFLPVMNGESLIDLLVCKLAGVVGRGKTAQPEFAWTHLTGTGAKLSALTVKAAAEGGIEEAGALLGGSAGESRVLNLNYFTPAAEGTDADGSNVSFSLTTRDIQTGNLVKNTVAKVRVSYRLVCPGGSGLKLAVGSTSATPAKWGQVKWGEFKWAGPTGVFTEESEVAPADSEGLNPFTWRIGKKVRYVRLRLELTGPTTSFSLRMIEIGVRPSGRIW